MELRVLKYFLAVAREQSISAAAQSLYLSQPTLSRQLKDLEDELGKQLLIRGNRRVTLTEEGMILRKRAEEIMQLVGKAESEIAMSDDTVAGDITIGAGESDGIRPLVRTACALQKENPLIRFHIVSGDKRSVLEDLDRGLIDFASIFGEIDEDRYEILRLPSEDVFGVLMRRDDALAEKETITADDLNGKPLIVSRQSFTDSLIDSMFAGTGGNANIVGTYNLLFNGSLMVDEGMGYAICFDRIINTSGDSRLCFRPFECRFAPEMHLAWKKYQVFSKASEKFIAELKKTL